MARKASVAARFALVLSTAVATAARGQGAPGARDAGAVAGTVRSEAGTPVSDAAVLLLGHGLRTLTDSSGRFFLSPVAPGTWRLDVRGVGYRSVQLAVTVRAGETTAVAVRLREAPITVAGVVATAPSPDRRRFESEAQSSTRALGIRDITSPPGLLETDVMRTVRLLPGVVARNDYSVGLHVRGGDADQNLVLLDGQTVYNPFHLGGLVSTFADEALSGVEFLAGGFPARYGGRLSSVLDIGERAGRRDGLHGSTSVSLLSARLHFEGPLPARLGSWLVAARRTYADRVVAAFTEETFPYYFHDALGRVTLDRVAGGTLAVSGFASGDFFDFLLAEGTSGQPDQSFGFAWGNAIAGLTWRRPLGAAMLTQRAGISTFFADIEVGPGLFGFRNRLRRVGTSTDLEWSRGTHTWSAGALLERHDVEYTASSGEVGLEFARLTYHPVAAEAYVDDQWRPRSWLLVRPGLRLTHVADVGFLRLAPRLAVKAFVAPHTAVTASSGRFYQYVHSLRNEEIPISLFEFWIGADRDVPVAAADHAVLGVERWLGEGVQVQVEGFWKRMWNLVDGDPTEDPGVRGDEFLTARGEASGLDLYVRRTTGRVTGWVAYTLGKVTRTLETGERFAPGQDRRHTLNAVAMFRGPLAARWTVRFGYGSPLPYTAIAGQWVHRFYDPGRNIFIGAFTEPYRTARNARRYPAYSRLDVSARWEFGWLGARWAPSLSLLNAYARTNVFVYFYDYTGQPPVRRGFSQLPFLPTIGLEVEW